MLVHNHMTPRPITLRTDTDFKSALQLMQQHSIHHLPVLGADERLVGIVAERDLMFAALRYLGSAVDVEQVMHRKVVTATPGMLVVDAASLMVTNAIGGLPVIDNSGHVVGVITETDIFKAFVRMHGATSSRPKKRTPRKSSAAKLKAPKKPLPAKNPASTKKPAARTTVAGRVRTAKAPARLRQR